jgi:hypothetical protein
LVNEAVFDAESSPIEDPALLYLSHVPSLLRPQTLINLNTLANPRFAKVTVRPVLKSILYFNYRLLIDQ